MLHILIISLIFYNTSPYYTRSFMGQREIFVGRYQVVKKRLILICIRNLFPTFRTIGFAYTARFWGDFGAETVHHSLHHTGQNFVIFLILNFSGEKRKACQKAPVYRCFWLSYWASFDSVLGFKYWL